MKHNDKTIGNVWQLHNQGFSSRQIAAILGISKSSVNDLISKGEPQYIENTEIVKIKSKRKPKIAVVDTETSAAVVYTFGRFDVNITQNAVSEEGGKILCACWKWLHKSDVEGVYMQPHEIRKGNDKRVVKALRKIYEKADAVIMHNGKKFDDKVIRTRSIFNELGPTPSVKVIDTLQMAKSKLRLPSYALDSIGAYFGLGRKIDTGGIELWVQVQKGCPEAMQKMFVYCKQDVLLLESVFFVLISLGIPGYNASLYYNDDIVRCKACGHDELEFTGKTMFTTLGEFRELQCLHCLCYNRERTNLKTASKRRSVLA